MARSRSLDISTAYPDHQSIPSGAGPASCKRGERPRAMASADAVFSISFRISARALASCRALARISAGTRGLLAMDRAERSCWPITSRIGCPSAFACFWISLMIPSIGIPGPGACGRGGTGPGGAASGTGPGAGPGGGPGAGPGGGPGGGASGATGREPISAAPVNPSGNPRAEFKEPWSATGGPPGPAPGASAPTGGAGG